MLSHGPLQTQPGALRASPAIHGWRSEIENDEREATADLEDSWQPASNDAAPRPRPSFDLALIEERLAGRVLAFTGGAALILGAVFFLSLAFSRGWIGPPLQVVLGLSAGSIGLLLGGALLLRGDRLVGHVTPESTPPKVSLAVFRDALRSLPGLAARCTNDEDKLLPDVLVKGGDWGTNIVGKEEVTAAGGRVVSLPYEQGYSTSELIERIAGRQ